MNIKWKNMLGLASVFLIMSTYAVSCESKVLAPDGKDKDVFGRSVSTANGVSVVGAMNKNYYTGSAYVYEQTGNAWSHKQVIVGSDVKSGEYFGDWVATNGTTIAVSAYMAGMSGKSSVGAVYLFEKDKNKWVEVQKLQPDVASASAQYGNSIAFVGNKLIISAYQYGLAENKPGTGTVFVYTRSGSSYSLTQKITAPTPVQTDRFGTMVAASGDILVISDQNRNKETGSAYVYRTDSSGSYVLEQEIPPASGVALDHFGGWVATDGTNVVVGSENANSKRGAVYLFRKTARWLEKQKVASPDNVGGMFGHAVDIYSGNVIVTARNDSSKASAAGSAYMFKIDDSTGNLLKYSKKLCASTPNSGAYYGFSTALHHNTILVGAYYDSNKNGSMAGAAYFYDETMGTNTRDISNPPVTPFKITFLTPPAENFSVVAYVGTFAVAVTVTAPENIDKVEFTTDTETVPLVGRYTGVSGTPTWSTVIKADSNNGKKTVNVKAYTVSGLTATASVTVNVSNQPVQYSGGGWFKVVIQSHSGQGGKLYVVKNDGTSQLVSQEYNNMQYPVNNVDTGICFGYYQPNEAITLKIVPNSGNGKEILSTNPGRCKVSMTGIDTWFLSFEDGTDWNFTDVVFKIVRVDSQPVGYVPTPVATSKQAEPVTPVVEEVF